jgi:hypothetical protein
MPIDIVYVPASFRAATLFFLIPDCPLLPPKWINSASRGSWRIHIEAR